MRWLLISALLLPGMTWCHAQAMLSTLPDAPSFSLSGQRPEGTSMMSPIVQTPCMPAAVDSTNLTNSQAATAPPACVQPPDLYQRFSNTPAITPMTAGQKGLLAVHNIFDPYNFATIGLTSAFLVGTNSHTAYGPGIRGFGRHAGYSLLQDATGEVLGTFAIASIAHEDPRYHRMPQARPMRRFLHAVSHTVISHHDDGRPMPNYETLLGYPLCAEISNLYVPGVASNGPSTVKRVAIGLAGDPVDNLVTEFFPDVAAHVHLRVIFVQRILNGVATGQPMQ